MAERKIIWSSRAKINLSEILEFYYKRNGTKTYSKKLNSDFRKSINRLKKHPDIGVRTDTHDIRNLIEGDFCVFYEIKPETIEILTIWGNRQNPENLVIKFKL